MSALGVDVIIPCYNYGRYLRACAASVLQETRLPIRVLIIDDASTDDTAAVARSLAAEHPQVEAIIHPTNHGHIATFNEGIAWVAQDYVLLLSADDMVAPGALARAVALMEANPGVAFTYGRVVHFAQQDELAGFRPEAAPPADRIGAGADFIRRFCARPLNPVETATAVVRTAVQKRVGGYRPHLPHACDLEMWLRCAAHGDVGEIGAVQGFVRIHGENMRDTYYGDNCLQDYRQRRDAIDCFFSNHHKGVAGAEALRTQALRSMAQALLWDASKALVVGGPYADMVGVAGELWPDVRRTRQFRRLQVKRLLAPLLKLGAPGRAGRPSFERAAATHG